MSTTAGVYVADRASNPNTDVGRAVGHYAQRYAHLSPAALVNTIRFLESRVADSGRGDILETALVTMLARRSTRRWFSPFFCATVSVALGAAYMYAAGAPSHYLLVNFSALAAGLLAASLVRSALVLTLASVTGLSMS